MKQALFLLLIFTLSCTLQAQNPIIGIEEIASGFNQPLDIQNAGDDRLFIVEKEGMIKILNPDGSINEEPFLSLDIINTGSEQGLLGLTFHPNYSNNGFFYVHYIDNDGNTSISRFSVDPTNPDLALLSSELQILSVAQPTPVHNSGGLDFGLEGYLYIALGDGGAINESQNTTTLLGNILRIDVDRQDEGLNYAIPPTNPFVNQEGYRPEIWDYGLRNPFRISVDLQTNELWIGEVGAATVEEINRSTGGNNFGWRCYEGDLPFDTNGCPPESELVLPAAQYLHVDGDNPFRCSVGGGYVYRGTAYPDMQGLYFFTDLCSNEIAYIDALDPQEITYSEQFPGNAFVSFGVNNEDELFITGVDSGSVYRVVDNNPSQTQTPNEFSFGITPNPASTNLVINATLPDNQDSENVMFYDLTGQLVRTERVSNGGNLIFTDQLSAGIYIIASENFGIVEKLIIN